jgi:hypothetical protein
MAAEEEYSRQNRDRPCLRACPDENGDPVLALDLVLAGGTCEGRLVYFICSCHAVAEDWFCEVQLNRVASSGAGWGIPARKRRTALGRGRPAAVLER